MKKGSDEPSPVRICLDYILRFYRYTFWNVALLSRIYFRIQCECGVDQYGVEVVYYFRIYFTPMVNLPAVK